MSPSPQKIRVTLQPCAPERSALPRPAPAQPTCDLEFSSLWLMKSVASVAPGASLPECAGAPRVLSLREPS
jgi:hypothetical protein